MKKISSWIIIVFLGLTFLFFMVSLFPSLQSEVNNIAGKEVKSLDARLSYTKNDVSQLFETVKSKGREKMEFISGVVDMTYPLIYGILFFLLMTKLTNSFSNNKWKTIRFLPLIGMLFDYVENFSILNMLNSYPIISETQVLISSSATSLKWFFVNISLLLIIFLTVVKIFQGIKTAGNRGSVLKSN